MPMKTVTKKVVVEIKEKRPQRPDEREHRTARLYEVIRVTCAEGAGIDEDPARYVEYYYHKDGGLICRYDEWEVEQSRKR